MEYSTLEIDLPEDDQLQLICSMYGISQELLEDIKSIESDHEKRIVQLVLSDAVAKVIMIGIHAEKDKEQN